MTDNRRWTITGGAGFLGYHLAKILAPRGIQITLLDIAAQQPSEYPRGVSGVSGDVRDAASLPALLRGSDVVIHAAAALPARSRREIMEVNVQGTRNVLQASVAVGVPRVVFVSSTTVFGIPEKSPLVETDAQRGVGWYGTSKIVAEQVCLEYRKKGLCVPIVRPGPFIGTGRMGVFQILYDWVLNGKRIPVIGDGTNRYQLLEVRDLVEAIFLAATAPPEQANDTFNLGATGVGTVAEDLGALCDHAGSGARILPTPAWAVKPALALFELMRISPLHRWLYSAADKDYLVSTEKIESQLGWRSRFNNVQALTSSYQWYLDHHRELAPDRGVTHRVRWDQGVLTLFRRWL